ncbi:MAG: hypothetical protein LQ345_004563 [Seirophora villosa]|nr:MAG: hypothetical protein LQ345_004563 [Seirophora villosa]
MTDDRHLRRRETISYEISSDSDVETASINDSPFGTPQKMPDARKRLIYEVDDESESGRSESPVKTPPPRLSTAGHSLRQPKDLHLSLRARENGDKSLRKERHATASRKIFKVTSDAPKPKTVRMQIREFIATDTTAKKNNFFIAHKDLFLPLLPTKNYITKIMHQQNLDAVPSSFGASGRREPQSKDGSVPYEDLPQQPLGIKASMKPYQLSGLSFLVYLQRNGLSGILGDEMGLGKTLQTLALLQWMKENQRQAATSEQRPSLVVCPLSVLSSWIAEARRWAPGLKVLRFHGPAHERERMKRVAMGEIDMFGHETKRNKVKKNDQKTKAGKPIIDLDEELETGNEVAVDLVITTYECFQSEQGWFKKAFVWNYCILDEGHKIKNDKTGIAKALQGLSAEFRLILTGTPLHNNMLELWALLHWLYPEVFTETTSELFKNAFDLTKGTVSTTFMDDSRRLLERIMLRRMKDSADVNLNLPPKTEVLLFVPLTPMQRFFYTRLMTRADQGLLDELFQGAQEKEAVAREQENQEIKTLEKPGSDSWEESKAILQQALQQEQLEESKTSAWRKLMNLLMQLRKVCNHPYLLPRVEPDPYYIGQHIINASGKFIVLDKLVNELVIKQNKKILIFSEFTRMLDCCEDFLNFRGGNGEKFRFLRLEGSTTRARRNLAIRLFNQEGSEQRVMLISTRAGGLGINLTAASDVVMLDQQWNPQLTLQAEARAHRIGQNKPVTIYKLCTQGTVEEQMLGRIAKKLYLSTKVTESLQNIHSPKTIKKGSGDRSAAADEDMPQLSTGQLMSLVRRGTQALAHPELDVHDMLRWDWATMLEKCRPADAMVAKDAGLNSSVKEEDENKWLQQVEKVHSRVFQGKQYLKQKDDSNSIAGDWISRADRRVGKETTVMVNGFAINKQSMSCGDWEAVPTLAGKDPRLAEPKLEKKPAVVNQEMCQVCWDGGELILCSGCPRSYHYKCLDPTSKARSRSGISFSCTQHRCFDCEQNTASAGGLIFRCRWCERGYCEDCLDFDKTTLIGDNLKEYELLQYPAVKQAYYICCPTCTDYHAFNPTEKAFCDQQAAEIDARYQMMLDEQRAEEKEEEAAAAAAAAANPFTPSAAHARKTHKSAIVVVPTPPSDTQSLTDASTIDDSAVATPRFGAAAADDGGGARCSSRRKRKAAASSFGLDSDPLLLPASDDSKRASSPCEPVELDAARAKRKRSFR